MAKAREELRLVRDFSELRAGVEVIDIDCRVCGRSQCRVTLVEPRDYGCLGKAWTATPNCRGNDRLVGVTDGAVRSRRIFLVVGPMRDETPTTTAAPRELERVR